MPPPARRAAKIAFFANAGGWLNSRARPRSASGGRSRPLFTARLCHICARTLSGGVRSSTTKVKPRRSAGSKQRTSFEVQMVGIVLLSSSRFSATLDSSASLRISKPCGTRFSASSMISITPDCLESSRCAHLSIGRRSARFGIVESALSPARYNVRSRCRATAATSEVLPDPGFPHIKTLTPDARALMPPRITPVTRSRSAATWSNCAHFSSDTTIGPISARQTSAEVAAGVVSASINRLGTS